MGRYNVADEAVPMTELVRLQTCSCVSSVLSGPRLDSRLGRLVNTIKHAAVHEKRNRALVGIGCGYPGWWLVFEVICLGHGAIERCQT